MSFGLAQTTRGSPPAGLMSAFCVSVDVKCTSCVQRGVSAYRLSRPARCLGDPRGLHHRLRYVERQSSCSFHAPIHKQTVAVDSPSCGRPSNSFSATSPSSSSSSSKRITGVISAEVLAHGDDTVLQEQRCDLLRVLRKR
jgi:hypothetical protein